MDDTQEILSISKVLEKMIDKTAHEIFKTHRERLLKEDNTYVIPGVWGAVKDGCLDTTQRCIHTRASALVEQALSELGTAALSPSQRFAIRYLVNRTLIYAISYMTQVTKSRIQAGEFENRQILMNLPPMGRA